MLPRYRITGSSGLLTARSVPSFRLPSAQYQHRQRLQEYLLSFHKACQELGYCPLLQLPQPPKMDGWAERMIPDSH